MTTISRMYNANPSPITPKLPVQQPTGPDKSAVRSLSGMKVHGSHLFQMNVDGEVYDVPKVQYVHLLEQQIKDARDRLKITEDKVARLERNLNKLGSQFRDYRDSHP